MPPEISLTVIESANPNAVTCFPKICVQCLCHLASAVVCQESGHQDGDIQCRYFYANQLVKASSHDSLAATRTIQLLHQACDTGKTLIQSSVGLAQSMASYHCLPGDAALTSHLLPGWSFNKHFTTFLRVATQELPLTFLRDLCF